MTQTVLYLEPSLWYHMQKAVVKHFHDEHLIILGTVIYYFFNQSVTDRLLSEDK